MRATAVVACWLALAVVALAQHEIPPLPPSASPAVTLPSGLKYIDIEKGHGVEVERGRVVRVLYTAWLTKTQYMFDVRDQENDPLAFRVGEGGVIKGLEEGVVGMRVGGQRRLLIPSKLGRGAKGSARVPPNSDLTYDVKVVAVSRPGA